MKMKIKYLTYTIKCKMQNKVPTDFIDYTFRTLFTREGVRV